jgi:MoxR-like ATPase
MIRQFSSSPEQMHSSFVEGVFGSGRQSEHEGIEEHEPFKQRPEEEQAALIYEIQSLVAERRDVIRTRGEKIDGSSNSADEAEARNLEGKKSADPVHRGGIGKRRFPTMSSVESKIETAQSDGREISNVRLQSLNARLQEIGTIPGIREAYGKEVSKLFFYGRLLRERERLLGEKADLEYAIRKQSFAARDSHAGVPVGLDLEAITRLESELDVIDGKLDMFCGASEQGEAQALSDEIKKERDRLRKINQERAQLTKAINKIDPEIGNDEEKQAKTLERTALEVELEQKQIEAEGIETGIAERKEKIRTLSEKQSIGPFLDRVVMLREYGESFHKGRIVELPSVEKLVELGLESLRDHRAFTLAGHLGSGKTEVARHIAKLFMLENAIESGSIGQDESYDEAYDRMRPEFFSGSEEASVYDLVGKLKIRREKKEDISPKKIAELVQGHIDELRATSGDVELDETRLKQLGDRVLERVLAASVSGGDMETAFAYGPLGRALKEEKPIIIDEVNMIPAQVLGRMNDIAIATVREPIFLQENGEEGMQAAPGFGILGTFNVGRQYHGTQDLNVAQASRWNGPKVDYPSMEESFDLVLSALIRKDRVRLPPQFRPEDYEKLTDLILVTRHIQELFSGQTEGQRYMARRHGMRAEKSQLEKTVISTRDLLRKIVIPWRDRGFKEGSLDEIIADNILATAGTHSEDDQRFLVELFLENGFFHGWDAKRFREHHVGSVEDEDIRTIQGVMEEDDYKANDPFRDIREETHTRTDGSLRSMLLLGRE